MSPQTKITDDQLHIRLVKSYLDFQQVLILTPMIPYMNDEQREELIKIIEVSERLNTRKKDADVTYNEKLSVLNQEYLQKMDHLLSEETNYARREYEKLGNENDASQLLNLEDQINNI